MNAVYVLDTNVHQDWSSFLIYSVSLSMFKVIIFAVLFSEYSCVGNGEHNSSTPQTRCNPSKTLRLSQSSDNRRSHKVQILNKQTKTLRRVD